MILISEHQHLRGSFECYVLHRRKIVDAWHDKNLIVDVGRDALARLLGGNRTDNITKIGFGTNGSAAVVGDTDLTAAYVRTIQDKRYSGYEGDFFGVPVLVTTGKVRFEWFLDNTEANGLTIREFGLLFNDESLFARHVRPASGDVPDTITKNPDLSLFGAWTIHVGT